MFPRASAPSSTLRRSSYTIWRCLFITSSYSTTCLRASKCMPSTFFWALDRTRDPRMLDGLHLEAVHQPADPVCRGAEDLHQVVFERDEKAARAWIALPAGAPAELVVDATALVPLGADDVKAAHLGYARSEHDVCAAAGHVGGDRDPFGLPCLSHNGRLPLVLLGVEHVVLHTSTLEHLGQAFRFFDRYRADQDWAAELVHLDNLVDHRLELRLLRLVDDVGAVDSHHFAVRRDQHHVEAVNLVELLRFGQRSSSHPSELLVLPEVVLNGDRRDGLLLLLHLDAFFRLYRLVQTIGPPPAGHRPARELIDDDHLSVLDEVLLVALEQRFRLERLVDLVRLDHVFEVVDVSNAGPPLHLRDAVLSQRRGLVLEVNLVVL